MFSYTKEASTITVNPEKGAMMKLEDLPALKQEFVAQLSSDVDTVTFDMEDFSRENFIGIAFLISCAESCEAKKIKTQFSNLRDPELEETLGRAGFDSSGTYKNRPARQAELKSVFASTGEAAIKIVSDMRKTIEFTGEVFMALGGLIRRPGKIDWKEVLFYMDKSGAEAIPIVIMICFLVGLILAFQGLSQMGRFGLSIYTCDLVGIALIRELGPLMVGMICIGRAGSAFAAELGTMKVAEELDAMHTMGLSPARFLVIPKIAALFISMPMLVIVGDVAGIGGGLFITTVTSDITVIEYCQRTVQALIPENVLESIVKGFVFSFIIGAVGCFRGMEADNDAKGVGKAATSAVVSGIFLVVIADALVTIIFPKIMNLFGVDY